MAWNGPGSPEPGAPKIFTINASVEHIQQSIAANPNQYDDVTLDTIYYGLYNWINFYFQKRVDITGDDSSGKRNDYTFTATVRGNGLSIKLSIIKSSNQSGYVITITHLAGTSDSFDNLCGSLKADMYNTGYDMKPKAKPNIYGFKKGGRKIRRTRRNRRSRSCRSRRSRK